MPGDLVAHHGHHGRHWTLRGLDWAYKNRHIAWDYYKKAERAIRKARGGRGKRKAGNALSQYDESQGVPKGNPNKHQKKHHHQEAGTSMAGFVGNIQRDKKSYGTKKKQTLAKLAKMMEMNTRYVTGRWQSILGGANFATGVGAHYMSNLTSGTTLVLPMYAFNLSTPCRGTTPNGSTDTFTCPMYRLQRVAPSVVGTANYQWVTVTGFNNDNLGNSNAQNWQIEDLSAPLAQEREFQHVWSDIKAVVYGAKNRQHTIHMDVVSFKNEFMPPLRNYNTGNGTALTVYDATGPAEENCDNDTWWDHFWSDKIGNPIRSSKYTGQQPEKLHYYHRNKFTINPDMTTDQDTASLRVVKDLFLREEKTYDVVSAVGVTSGLAGNVPVIGANQIPNFDDTSTAAGNSCGLFPRRERDKWLLIWCEDVFDQAAAASALTHPAFDINVRAKWKFPPVFN